jgi:ribonuclease G
MVERVVRYKETASLMEAFGVEQEIKSTLSRRVDLPSGGYLIFDYAEAFTVIDVNTGRFVGSRGKSSGARLEDTITKNNLEAVKEVVRQLRLRDIGGIIVIDFIDMANPKNRATVEEALRTELERDRTKTYVVEISPLGLVEMTRQNVTDGPREIMTRKCPTCGGDGIVYSEASAAIDVERRLRALVARSRSQAFRIELAAPIAAAVVGPGARRLLELESLTKRKFFLEGKPDTHLDHFVVLGEGKLADLAPPSPVEEGAELMLELVEVDGHDGSAGVGKVDGLDIVVADASSLVGKKQKVRVERVLDGTAYATLLRSAKKTAEPLTAEAEAEKPTRKPPARKGADGGKPEAEAFEADDELEAEEPLEPAEAAEIEEPLEVTAEAAEALLDEPEEAEAEDAAAEASPDETPAKKKTRRGSRGGKKRKQPAAAGAEAPGDGAEVADSEAAVEGEEPVEAAPAQKKATIHVPSDDLGREDEDEEAEAAEASGENGAAPAKKRTRRGSRGGKNRRKRVAAAGNGGEPAGDVAAEDASEEGVPELPDSAAAEHEVALEPVEEPSGNGVPEDEWGYVPMSEWGDEFK